MTDRFRRISTGVVDMPDGPVNLDQRDCDAAFLRRGSWQVMAIVAKGVPDDAVRAVLGVELDSIAARNNREKED